jgi:predicted transposase YbfD/YdcC
MKLKPRLLIVRHFNQPENSCEAHVCYHKLTDIIALALCASIWGANSSSSIERYGKAKYHWLKQFLELPNGIPSEQIFTQVLSCVHPDQLQHCLLGWLETMTKYIPAQTVDLSKRMSHSDCNPLDGREEHIHAINAHCTANSLAFSPSQVHETHKKTFVLGLLKLLDTCDCIITTSEIDCLREVTKLIIECCGHYCLALPKRESGFLQSLNILFSQIHQLPTYIDHSFHETIDEHECVRIQRCWTASCNEVLAEELDLVGLCSVSMIESELRIDKCVVREKRYCVSSYPTNAQILTDIIHMHWDPQRCLYSEDIVVLEDTDRISRDHAPQNLDILRFFATNALSYEIKILMNANTILDAITSV